jgi:regulator of sigma E protease
MDFLLNPVVAIVILLGVLIFIHELGHFLVGKWFGIGVEIFSIGFGPSLFSYTFRHTEYRLSILPFLGGFVKFAGSHPNEEVPVVFKGMEMHLASRWARFWTISAGPLANLLLALCLFWLLAMTGLEYYPPVIEMIRPDSIAEKADLRVGDRVEAVDGVPMSSWNELHTKISDSPHKEIVLDINRL